MDAVVGVDIGTSSSKGVIVALDGTILATAVREHGVARPHPGWVEMPAETWWDEFTSIVQELIGGHSVVAVGVSGMGPCVAVASGEGVPLRPAILYGVDSRATAQIAELTDELGAEAIVARCGSALSTQAAGPKLAWIAENEPAIFAHARRLFMPASWLVWNLTGEYVLDHHSASQCTPMYDLDAQDWYRPWAERLAGPIALPRLLWADEIAGRVSAQAAAITGLAPGIPVIAGTIDAWTEAVSVGANGDGDLMLMYGTTMFLISSVAGRVDVPGLWSTAGVFADERSLAGGMASSGAITAWLRTLVGSPSYPELLGEAELSPPGAKGLLLLPYFAGERTPIADPDARGVLAGLTLEHTRGDLYRAALEATAMGVRHNVATIRRAGARIARIIAVGGGAQSDLWLQIVSDVTGLTQQIPRETVGASYGAAYLAARAWGITDSIDDWNPIERVIEPSAGIAAAYDEQFALYLRLYEETVDVVHALAGRQREGA